MLLPDGRNSTCACYSFCTLHDAVLYVRLIPDALHGSSSPWLAYLRGVYGSAFTARLDAPLDELVRLQLLYTRGVPIARCAPLHGTRVAHATIPTLPRRVDAMCDKQRCAAWYPPEGRPAARRPSLRGIEPYFGLASVGASPYEVVAFRWWWRDSPTFAPSGARIEVFRWKRRGEGERGCAVSPERPLEPSQVDDAAGLPTPHARCLAAQMACGIALQRAAACGLQWAPPSPTAARRM